MGEVVRPTASEECDGLNYMTVQAPSQTSNEANSCLWPGKGTLEARDMATKRLRCMYSLSRYGRHMAR